MSWIRSTGWPQTRLTSSSRACAAVLAIWAGAAVEIGAAGSAWAEDGAKTVFAMEHAGLAAWASHPKDKALAAAMGMVPARLSELAREVDDVPPEAARMANIGLAALARPTRVAVVYNPDNPQGGAFGYGLVVSIKVADEQQAADLALVAGLAADDLRDQFRLVDSATWPGMTEIRTPFAIVSYGPRRAPDGLRYEIIAGSVSDPDGPFAGWAFGGEGRPVARAMFDGSGLATLMETGVQLAGQQNPQAAEQLRAFLDSGVFGPEGVRVQMEVRQTEDRMVSRTVMENLERFAGALGMSTATLTPADLALVPADATAAWCGGFDLAWLGRALDQAIANSPEAAQGLEQFRAQTGIDLRADVLDAIGGPAAVYVSDATGGGSMLSAVAVVTLRDPDRFGATTARLTAMANALGDRAPMGPGYIKVRPWSYDGVDLVSLQFPGLPVPVELSYAVRSSKLILGPTPQAVIAAARQAAGRGDKGLASNPALAALLPKGRAISTLTYADTDRTLRSGYPLLTLIGSALGNAVRSPGGEGRDPGLIVPPFQDLRRGVVASVQYSFWHEGDYIVESHGDPSLLVNMASQAGAVMNVLPALAIPALGGLASERFGPIGLAPAVPAAELAGPVEAGDDGAR